MSYYFNMIYDFLTLTTISLLCISISYFSKGFLRNCEISQTMCCCMCISSYFFDTIFSKILLASSGDIASLTMNILCTGDKSAVQRDFFKNNAGDLLPALKFLGGLHNFVIIFYLM